MLDLLRRAWARAYASPTFYRLFWTTIQAGAGIAATELSDDPKIGVAVLLLTTVLTSLARERLESRR